MDIQNKSSLSEEKLFLLRERVKEYQTEKRYRHTLAVEREAAALGEIFLPEKVMSLRCSALLHDITKVLSLEKQLQYCQKFDIMVRNSDVLSPKIFHAKTAASLANEVFAEFVDKEIISGIRWHTTGRRDMTLFECIVYLADYIEDTRTFEDCVELRRYFYDSINKDGTDKYEVLLKTMIKSFDMTIKNLVDEGALIDEDTVEARNYFIENLAKRQESKNG